MTYIGSTQVNTQRSFNRLTTNNDSSHLHQSEKDRASLVQLKHAPIIEQPNSEPFSAITSPEHVREQIDRFNLNQKLVQIREQNAIPLSLYGEGKGAEYADGSKGALIKLEQTEIFYLADANGAQHYYLLDSNGEIGQPITEGTNILMGGAESSTLTLNIDDDGTLKITGLQPQHDQPLTTATFHAQTGFLGAHSHPEGHYGLSDMHGFTVVDLWKDPQLATTKAHNAQRLETVREQDETVISDYVTIQNAEYIDGSRTALMTFGNPNAFDRTQVFLIENPDGEKRYYEINANGELGVPLRENQRITTESSPYKPSLTLLVDESNNLNVTVKENKSGFPRHTVTLDSTTNVLSTTAYLQDSNSPDPSTTTSGGLWNGANLQYEGPTADATYSTRDQYNYYANTTEGQAIISAEGAYFTPPQEIDQRLFIARVQYNRGQGGVELFAEFMPKRTALLDNPEALAAYDLQLERALAHVKNDSYVSETGLALDPSLQFIVASGVTEAVGHNPELMNKVLSDLDRGWVIEYDLGEYAGLYSQRQPLFQSQKAWISLELSAFLITYVRPERLDAVMPHELAHSLDSYDTKGLDGIPSDMQTADVGILISERNALFEIYNATGDQSGLRQYAYENVKEFFAEVSSNYLSSEASAQVVWNASPNLFAVLQRYYGLNYNFG